MSVVQVCSNALIPLLAALALVPITGGADVLLSSAASRDAVRYLGAFFGEHFSAFITTVPQDLSACCSICNEWTQVDSYVVRWFGISTNPILLCGLGEDSYLFSYPFTILQRYYL